MAGGDPSKIKTIAAYSKQIFMDDALSMMYNSMLSDSTHIVNTLGNLINVVMRPASAALGGKSLERKMAAAAFANFGETIHEALRVARITLETAMPSMMAAKALSNVKILSVFLMDYLKRLNLVVIL